MGSKQHPGWTQFDSLRDKNTVDSNIKLYRYGIIMHLVDTNKTSGRFRCDKSNLLKIRKD